MTVPILFLIFNRPDTTARVFEAIRAARPPRLYVAADGPRQGREGEAERCESARKIATTVDWPCEVNAVFRESNLGCRVAVSSAIDWFFEAEQEGIILEDDCLPASDFFRFCSELLERFRHDNRVMAICGSSYAEVEAKYSGSYYCSYYADIWGGQRGGGRGGFTIVISRGGRCSRPEADLRHWRMEGPGGNRTGQRFLMRRAPGASIRGITSGCIP